MPTWTTERARIASLTRSRTPDDPELLAARRNLAAARLRIKITEVVDAGLLTADQRSELALLLTAAEPIGRRALQGRDAG